MSIVNITDVTVKQNPAKFEEPYVFKITFECIAPLKEDLEWKLVYVGSAETSKFDQELDTCLVGPVPVGVNSFEFEAKAPTLAQIPKDEVIGVTVILLTCSYNEQEFVRVGYYVNTEYDNEEMKENPPENPVVDKLVRNVLVEKPRVTRVNISWDSIDSATLTSAADAQSSSGIPTSVFQPEPSAGPLPTIPSAPTSFPSDYPEHLKTGQAASAAAAPASGAVPVSS